jgi:hypothetical protein
MELECYVLDWSEPTRWTAPTYQSLSDLGTGASRPPKRLLLLLSLCRVLYLGLCLCLLLGRLSHVNPDTLTP